MFMKIQLLSRRLGSTRWAKQKIKLLKIGKLVRPWGGAEALTQKDVKMKDDPIMCMKTLAALGQNVRRRA
jgi:hypothetical protein